MSKVPAVYLIGGGELGARVRDWARASGLALIVTDREADAPGFDEAAAWARIDGADAGAHVDFVTSLRERFDVRGAYCGAEFGVASVQRVQRALDLPFVPEAALRRALDKTAMKDAFRRADVPTPAAAAVHDGTELAELIELMGRPGQRWVVKPAGGSGSRGVRIVAPGDDLHAAARASLAAVAGESTLVCEPYLIGRSIDANGLFHDGRFHPCGVLEKFITPAPDCLPIGGCDPADLSGAETNAVYALLEQACRALGLDVGPVKGDFLLTDDGWTVLEVAPRFHGDVTTSNTLPFGSRIEPVRWLFESFATGSFEPEPVERVGHGCWRVIALPPGRVRAWPSRAPDTPSRSAGVTCVWHNPRVSETIPRYTDTTTIPGYACAFGDTRAEAEAALRAWFEHAGYDVEPEAAELAWYRELGRELERSSLDPRASGHRPV